MSSRPTAPPPASSGLVKKKDTNQVIFSVDVDYFPGSRVGVDRIVEALDTLGGKACFFITGMYALDHPDSVRELMEKGHEIGCHGHSHGIDWDENFKSMPYEEQSKRIELATDAIEKACGIRPVMFRAPYLHVNGDTLRALEEQGYLLDSSVGAMRFDFGVGVANDLGSFKVKKGPYHPDTNDLRRPGSSSILEVPSTNVLLPYSYTTFRVISSKAFRVVDAFARIIYHPPVFLMHPWEVMTADEIKLPGMPDRHMKGRSKAIDPRVMAAFKGRDVVGFSGLLEHSKLQ